MSNDEWPTWARFVGHIGNLILAAVAVFIFGVTVGIVALAKALL